MIEYYTMKRLRASIFFFVIAAAVAPVAAGAAMPSPFNRDLYYGLRRDAEVVRLQDFLRERGFFTFAQSTGNFFGTTRGATQQFQAAQRISPVSGYFGPLTRGAANKLLGASPPAGTPPGSAALASPPGASPYRGKVEMTTVRGRETTADKEQVILRNKSTAETITVTGFRIENSRGGSVAIPTGFALPGFSPTGAADPIRLQPGDQVIVSFGKQERQMNFRENLCTGYFDQTSKFTPSLAHRCPRLDPKEFPQLSDRCIRQLEGISSCRIPQLELFTDSPCSDFTQAHFNYAGCVRDYREKPNFYATRWLVWLQREGDFFRNVLERVTLKDADGKVVDEFEY